MTNKQPLVPMSYPDISDAERDAVMSVLQTPNLSMGPQISAFENSFCRYLDIRNALGVNSGTAGLHLCVRAAGIETGDLVITTPFSFVASANAILFEHAIPIFVDVDPRTGNIDPLMVAEAARDLTSGGAAARRWLPRRGAVEGSPLKGIISVDVFGQPADLDSIQKTAADYHLKLIEDSCEALGAEYKGRKAGTFGDFGVFAFYPNKQITTGEGGMVVTNNDESAQYMRALRNQGRAPGDNWLQHTHMGYNYRLDELSAALGVVQMTRIESLLEQRHQVAEWYGKYINGIPGIETPYIAPETTRVSWFVYVIRVDRSIDRGELAARLAEKGIPVRPYFLPIHLQPYMAERFGWQPGDFPVTEDLGERGLALPFSGKMTEEQVQLVCHTLRSVL